MSDQLVKATPQQLAPWTYGISASFFLSRHDVSYRGRIVTEFTWESATDDIGGKQVNFGICMAPLEKMITDFSGNKPSPIFWAEDTQENRDSVYNSFDDYWEDFLT